MMLVASSTSPCPSAKSSTAVSSASGFIRPCATTTSELRRELGEPGLHRRDVGDARADEEALPAAPLLAQHRLAHDHRVPGSTKVRVGCRFCGGVASTLTSRSPTSAACIVRGIGVAVMRQHVRRHSAQLRLVALAEALLLVDHGQAELAEAQPGQALRADHDVDLAAAGSLPQRGPAAVAGAMSPSTRIPVPSNRRRNTSQMLPRQHRRRRGDGNLPPDMAAAAAARIATSVLPKPTSPQTSRSIGWPLARSLQHGVDRGTLVLAGCIREAAGTGRSVPGRTQHRGLGHGARRCGLASFCAVTASSASISPRLRRHASPPSRSSDAPPSP